VLILLLWECTQVAQLSPEEEALDQEEAAGMTPEELAANDAGAILTPIHRHFNAV